eukprot:CAMPEP_0202440564 /NCGR_PEP_ID=MMETSP1345-20130828/36762_1 /ASSEMBLY_ACC=CAM_ASM_000843 /TAXON_ID=342563 /ORGANISM="Fabrea Fabrea salina" /LENGTH=144 /DNA_ID=CAMNT_0049055175 /DNA_START=865 /DNA_END=1300 /DNA_ORIENTATION=-
MLEYHYSIEELKSSKKKGKKKKSLSLTTSKIQETGSLIGSPKVFKPANIPAVQPKTQYKVNSPKPLFAKTPEESSVEVKYYEEQPVKRNQNNSLEISEAKSAQKAVAPQQSQELSLSPKLSHLSPALSPKPAEELPNPLQDFHK